MASSSEIVTDAGFWASVCAGGDGVWLGAGGDCAQAAAETAILRRAKMENANVVNAWAVSLLKEGGTQIGVPLKARKRGGCYAGGARAGMRGTAGLGAKLSRWGSGPGPVGTGIHTRMLAGGGSMA
jgi:hypothetical protein